MNLERLKDAIERTRGRYSDRTTEKKTAPETSAFNKGLCRRFPLKVIRKTLCMRQSDVAAMFGCAQQTISNYERYITPVPYEYAAKIFAAYLEKTDEAFRLMRKEEMCYVPIEWIKQSPR